MAASYPSAVKTFVTRTSGQVIQPAHVNDLQDEVTAVEQGLINGVAHTLKPNADSTYDLGTAAVRFATLFVDALVSAALKLDDTDASHFLRLIAGSNLTADRILTLVTGDAARTVTLTGNPTLADWFDQPVKAASAPTFGGATLNGITDVRSGNQIRVNRGDNTEQSFIGQDNAGPYWSLGGFAATVFQVVSGAGTHLFNLNFTGQVTTPWKLAGTISPAALATGDNNNWNPTGLATCNRIRVTPDGGGTSVLTGITAPATDGTILLLQNIHATAQVLLEGSDAASTAANRFGWAAATFVGLNPGHAIELIYDSTSARWFVLGRQAA